jgi:putative DNA primase/helicase
MGIWTKSEHSDSLIKQILIQHGDSRFQLFKQRPNRKILEDSKSRTVNRIGFRREASEGDTEYIIPPDSLKDVRGPYDPDLLMRALQKHGLLETSDSRHKTVLRTLPELGRCRCYVVKSRIFDDLEEEKVEGHDKMCGSSGSVVQQRQSN